MRAPCPPVPYRLLTEAELLSLAPGDCVRRSDGDWFVLNEVYADPNRRASLGQVLVGIHGFMAGTQCGWSDNLVGPTHVSGDQWNGTKRADVRFASRVADRVAA